MNTKLRVVLADDHSVIRELIQKQLLQSDPLRYEVVGGGGTGQEAVDVCLRTQPDLLLLDLMLPGLNGVEVLRRLRPKMPRLRTLFFSASVRTPFIQEAIGLGASGFVCKSCPWKMLLEAISLVGAGGKYFDPKVAYLAGSPGRESEANQLTAREREVVQLIAEGHSTKEIGNLLGVSTKTIDKHRTGLMGKLQVHDAVAVTRYAIHAGLVSLD